jgi:solute carrier family 13 (sodium-dependent dicarboxylate transporter), member 2/3/5
MALKRTGFFLGPLIFLFFFFSQPPLQLSSDAWLVLGVASWMIIYWISEAIPIPVTALFPMIFFPLLGISDIKSAATHYANPVVYLFFGGFMLALAMEKWNLHRRIALKIVQYTGTNANGIILGFMISTAFLSMWISNTATAIMMLPIALSVVDLMTADKQSFSKKGLNYFSISIMLGIAYAANIGGTATIIGTPPNVVFAAYLRENLGIEIAFAKWIAIGLPFASLLLMITYFILIKVLYPNRLGNFDGAKKVIDKELELLGPISKGESRTFFVFLFTAFMWIFRVQINRIMPGAGFSDTEIALLAAILLFLIPVDFKQGLFLLDWKSTEKLPWGILLLFGGGLSLASSIFDTGLVNLIASWFSNSESALLVTIGLTTIALFLTEIISNVALVTIFLPIVSGIAIGLGLNPIFLSVPVTLAASCAFMLPMATPPNAIVYASGFLTVQQMAKAGFIINLISILCIALINEHLVKFIFQF